MVRFVDTSFLLALTRTRDAHHAAAVTCFHSLSGRFLLTEYVVLETVNALSATATRDLAWRLVQLIRQEPRIEIIPSSGELLDKGLELFRGRPDKDWSLTDCISFVVMQERGLTEALTADHHFEQAGFRALLRP